MRFAVEVGAVTGAVLRDEDDFFGSLVDEVLGFGKDFFKRKRSLFSSDFWDDTE